MIIDLQRIFILSIAFLMIAILSAWVDRFVKLVNINQQRPTSPFKKYKIALMYIQLIAIAFVGLLLEWGIRKGLGNVSFQLIFPLIAIFIPISFITVTICVPKKSKKFFSPYWYEWLLSIILFSLGMWWLISMIRS